MPRRKRSARVKAVPLPFNPDVLIWARQRRGITVDEVAQSLNVKPQKVFSWEDGSKHPTARQGRELAHQYDRPFLEFFSPAIPEIPDVLLVPDFRFHRNPPSEKESIALREVQIWAEEQRLNALSLMAEMGEQPRVIPSEAKFTLGDDVEKAAKVARDKIGFTLKEQLAFTSQNRDQLPSILREKFESFGILVLKQSGIVRLHARGICLYSDPLPIIVFGSEAASGQAFTLAHELGHVLLGKSGISGVPRFGTKVTSPKKSVENWCNRFAAAFLVPEDRLALLEQKQRVPADSISDSRLDALAKTFSVSRHAMLIRLVNLGYVAPAYYWMTKRQQFLAEEQTYKGRGRPAYYGVRYITSRGRFYTGLVLEAWESGHISSHNAAEFMGISNLQHLQDIKQKFSEVNG